MAAQSGNTVHVHYTGKLVDGTQFDSSEGREPLTFQLGSGMVIPGFDNGVTGMEVGDKKTITIPFMEAYGPIHEEAIMQFPRTQIPADLPLEVGSTLYMNQEGSMQPIPVVIREVADEYIVIDANHELAGKDLVFDLELVKID